MKASLGVIGILVLVFGIFTSPLLASAQTYQQVVSTDAGTLKVGISTEPASPKAGESSKLKIDFLNPQTNSIQEHIDYTVTVTNGGSAVFGPIPLTHTSIGTATIPIEFKDGENKVTIDIQGILFRPIPSEKATFSITLGQSTAQPKEEPKVAKPTEQKQTETAPKPKLPPVSSDEKKSKNSKVGGVAKEGKQLGKPKYEDIKKKSTEDKKKDTKKVTKKTVKKTVKPSTKSD
ncbi:MAG: hypothetical protein QXN55_03420 [Candidatus Nitrosotenuis sp.]